MRRSKGFKGLLCIGFSALALSTPYVWKQALGEFRLGKLYSFQSKAAPLTSGGVSTSLHSELEDLFKGPFTYLAHGAQSFVFQSENGDWTLKFFRYDRWIHPWRQFIRNEIFKKKKRLPYDKKIQRVLSSAKIAFEHAADLTGIFYTHLHPTEENLPTVVLIDPLGRTNHLDLNTTSFVIQRRARPIKEVFLETIRQDDHEKFKRLTRSFIHLLKTRAARGIRNADTKVSHNFGFWKENAMEWDFGNYWIDQEMKGDLDKLSEINQFILKPERFMTEFPEWREEYRKEIAQCV